MMERNYPSDNIIIVYFGGNQYALDEVGEAPFKRQLFLAQIGSALQVKVYIEQYRSQNAFGNLIWQLNEIWPTGGWGTIEYGTTSVKGQVVGGRWKPIQYWLSEGLFTDIIIACGSQYCYVKNDFYLPTKVNILIQNINLTDGNPLNFYSASGVSLDAGPGFIHWFTVSGDGRVLDATVTDSATGAVVSHNLILRSTPADLGLKATDISLQVADSANSDQSVNIVLQKGNDHAALYVTLTTQAQGRFSRNAFLMRDNKVTVTFIPFGTLDLNLLRSTIRVEHVNQYLQ